MRTNYLSKTFYKAKILIKFIIHSVFLFHIKKFFRILYQDRNQNKTKKNKKIQVLPRPIVFT